MDFKKRVLEYATETSIKFVPVSRFSKSKTWSLPELRGFAPHLRQVFQYKDQTACTEPWLIHDLLHIMFYDFASYHLGTSVWTDGDRFIECHLASEAFAVLSLDYHDLIPYRKESLAIDLTISSYKKFQKFWKLPALDSVDFTSLLTNLYLSGDEKPFLFEKPKTMNAEAFEKYKDWIGHEIRYGAKQRVYASWWLQDLQGRKVIRPTQAIVQGSYIAEGVSELLATVFNLNSKQWRQWTGEMARFLKDQTNFFNEFPKYNTSYETFLKNADSRFTGPESIDPRDLKNRVQAASKPSGDSLFLFWQLIAMQKAVPHEAREALAKLSLESQGQKAPSAKLWKQVQEMCVVFATECEWDIQPHYRACFFLP